MCIFINSLSVRGYSLFQPLPLSCLSSCFTYIQVQTVAFTLSCSPLFTCIFINSHSPSVHSPFQSTHLHVSHSQLQLLSSVMFFLPLHMHAHCLSYDLCTLIRSSQPTISSLIINLVHLTFTSHGSMISFISPLFTFSSSFIGIFFHFNLCY